VHLFSSVFCLGVVTSGLNGISLWKFPPLYSRKSYYRAWGTASSASGFPTNDGRKMGAARVVAQSPSSGLVAAGGGYTFISMVLPSTLTLGGRSLSHRQPTPHLTFWAGSHHIGCVHHHIQRWAAAVVGAARSSHLAATLGAMTNYSSGKAWF